MFNSECQVDDVVRLKAGTDLQSNLSTIKDEPSKVRAIPVIVNSPTQRNAVPGVLANDAAETPRQEREDSRLGNPPMRSENNDIPLKLRELKALRQENVITEGEYQAKKKSLLENF